MLHIPSQIPAPQTDLPDVEARIALSIEWNRRPAYAVVALSALNRLKTAKIHWIDLYTGPITWQIREAGIPGSIANCEMIRHSVTLTPKFFW